MNRASFLLPLAASWAIGCIDFGYGEDLYSVDSGPEPEESMPEPMPGADASTEPDPTECVEGITEPTSDGPQLTYVTLNVDKPILTIASGDVVTWTNTDTMRHSVVAGAPGAEIPEASGGFSSGEFGPSSQWAYRFCDPRTVFYFCGTHPNQMNGYRIVVE